MLILMKHFQHLVCANVYLTVSLDHKQLVDEKKYNRLYMAAKYLLPLQPKQQLYQVCN